MQEKERYRTVVAEIRSWKKSADAWEAALIDRLTTGESSREICNSVYKNMKSIRLRNADISCGPEATYIANLIRLSRNVKYVEFKRQAAHSKELGRIAEKARELADLLTAKNEGNSFLARFFPLPSYGYSHLGGESLFLSIAINEPPFSDLTSEAHRICRKSFEKIEDDEKKAYEALLNGKAYEDASPQEQDAIESWEPPPSPDWILANLHRLNLVHILRQTEKRAIDAANSAVLVKRAESREAAEKRWICSNLYDLHLALFGSPLWETLVLATTLCLDLDPPLTADDIRPLLKDKAGGK